MTNHVHWMHIAAMTTLDAWMGEDKDDRWLADRIGSSRSQASRIRRGVSRPSPDKAFKIEKITKGAVKAASLLTAPSSSEAA